MEAIHAKKDTSEALYGNVTNKPEHRRHRLLITGPKSYSHRERQWEALGKRTLAATDIYRPVSHSTQMSQDSHVWGPVAQEDPSRHKRIQAISLSGGLWMGLAPGLPVLHPPFR